MIYKEDVEDARELGGWIALGLWIAMLAALLVLAPAPADLPEYEQGESPALYWDDSR